MKLRNVVTWLCFFSALIYGHSLTNQFVYDDEEQIVGNAFIKSLDHFSDFFTGSTMNNGGTVKLSGIYYRPIMTLTFALQYAAFGLDSFKFHLIQLILCTLNSILVFFLFRFFIKDTRAFVLACIFLLHPLNTEVTVYAANLQDVLYVFFGLSALNFLIWAKLKHIWLVSGLTLFLLLSVLSKESGFLFIIFAAVFSVFFEKRRRLPVVLACGIVMAIYAFLRIDMAQLTSVDHNISMIGRAPLGTRLMTMPAMLWTYFLNFIFPYKLIINQQWLVTEFNLTGFFLPLMIDGIIVSGMLLYLIEFKNLKFGFFLLVAGLSLGMHLNFLPLDATVADRWMYLPIIGLLGMLGVVTEKVKSSEFKKVLVFILLIALGARAYVRSTNWNDGFTLYSHDILLNPQSTYLQNNLGVELFRKGQIVEAREHFEKSVEISPNWDIAWSNLGVARGNFGDFEKAEKCYLESMKFGDYYLAHENYGKLLYSQKRFAELRKFLETSLKKFPNNESLNALANHIP